MIAQQGYLQRRCTDPFSCQKEFCEPAGVRDWVYLGKVSDQTFFMDTIDKHLCITGEKNFKLISRKVKENL